MEADGIYYGVGKKDKDKQKDRDKNGTAKAIEDAKRAAIWTLLFSGTDPILKTPEQKRTFEGHQTAFFNSQALKNYISFEETKFILNQNIPNNGKKITKIFNINLGQLIEDLENRYIIDKLSDIMEVIGYPILLVMPEVKTGQSPIDVLRSDDLLKHAAGVIESYLTQKKYDVVVPQQQEQLSKLNEVQLLVGGQQDDVAYSLALSIGADIYITFSGVFDNAGYNTQKCAMTLKAYESTTAKLLGTETGYSNARVGERAICIEEAVNDALTKVLSRVQAYWKDDMENGIQFKLVVSIAPGYSDNDIDDIQDSFKSAIRKISNRNRALIETNQTLDYMIWCDPLKYEDAGDVYRDLRDEFARKSWGAKLNSINRNRKMLLLKIN
jgi:hypothetical protein